MQESTVAALLGALIGGFAGVAGQLVAAWIAGRTERRRIALDTGLREWAYLLEHHADRENVAVYPPALFAHFNYELSQLLDSGLTPEKYRDLLRRRDAIRDVIKEDSIARNPRRARDLA